MRNAKLIAVVMSAVLLMGTASCSNKSGVTDTPSSASETAQTTAAGTDYLTGHATFEVSSSDLSDGFWVEAVANVVSGENASPELEWEAVEGASCYVIYMVDMSTNGFLHWKSNNVTETKLQRGWAPSSDYVGPYPPEGSTHVYDIYVIALKTPVERLKGGLNGINPKMEEFIQSVDTDPDGNSGNIIAYGRISGKFTG